MSRHNERTVYPSPTTHCGAAKLSGARPLLPADSEPRDWRELGRRVLAEALRRATDELARRGATRPASVVPHFARESRS